MSEEEGQSEGKAYLSHGFSTFLDQQLEYLARNIVREHERLVSAANSDKSVAGQKAGAPNKTVPAEKIQSSVTQSEREPGLTGEDPSALSCCTRHMCDGVCSAGALSDALRVAIRNPPVRRYSIGSCSLHAVDILQESAAGVPRRHCPPEPPLATRDCATCSEWEIQEEASPLLRSQSLMSLNSKTRHTQARSSVLAVPEIFSCPDVGVYMQQGVNGGGSISRRPPQSSQQRCSFSGVMPTKALVSGCSSGHQRMIASPPSRSASPPRRKVSPLRSRSENLTFGPVMEQERTDSRQSGLHLDIPGSVESLGYFTSACRQDSVQLTRRRLKRASSQVSSKSVLGGRVASGQIVSGGQFTCRLLSAWEGAMPVRPMIRVCGTQSLGNGSRRASLVEESEERCLSNWVSRPNSNPRLVWDFCGILWVLFECILAPLEFISTGVADRVQPPVLEWFNRIFWTADMIASFFSGYTLASGSVEMRPSKTARRYMRTWLLPDALMVGADWMEVVLDQEAKMFRILGMIRIVRLLRLLRLKNTIRLFLEQLRSERAELIIGITRSTVAILAVAHFMACIWVGIGRSSGPRGWVHLQPEQVETSNIELYVISLHWSLTNFAGSMELSPVNALERLFAMCTLFFGFVAASCFVSHITSNMTRLSIIVGQKATQIRMLNKYLQERSIPIGLQHRVILNAYHVMSEQQQKTPEEHVALLQHLSDHLRAELSYEIYKPVILNHPLMARLISINMRGMQQLCHSALSLVRVAEGDVLFSHGEAPECPKMIFVESGVLAYLQSEGLNIEEEEEQVVAQQWLCEQVLWSDWVYHGTLYALELSRLVTLDAQKFRDIMRSSQSTSRPLSKYAAEFVKSQNTDFAAKHRSDIGSRKECQMLVGLSFPRPSVERFSSPLGQFGAFLRPGAPSTGCAASASTPDKPQHVW